MSYQRWNEGDAYVIGTGGDNSPAIFHCVACEYPHHKNYKEIIDHLKCYHENSNVALDRLTYEANSVGYDKTWKDYLPVTKESETLP